MLQVRIEASSAYDIWIGGGLIGRAGEWIAREIAPCNVALVTDDVVDGLYGRIVTESLEGAGFTVHKFRFPNGERSKTLGVFSQLLEFMGGRGFTRSDLVVCLGGGVVGDLGAFAAAVYGRGMRFVQLPTTLLAAVDSSVGGKTAVNLGSAKNMAGAFAQPALVLCDTDVMRALPPPLVQDGAAEIVKYGVLDDPTLLELAGRGALMEDIDGVIERCVKIKRDYVARDEFDEGKRQLLNLGHTVGHAIEKCSGFGQTHGQGVAVGMMVIARAARALGVSEQDCAPPIERALAGCGLPTRTGFRQSELLPAMALDKKRRGAEITLAVPMRIGHCELIKAPIERLCDWLAAGGIEP